MPATEGASNLFFSPDGAWATRVPSSAASARSAIRMSHGGQDDVMRPAGIAASFEMVEPEFALEFLVLLFERPALMDQAHERAQGGGRGQIDEVVLDARLGSGLPFAEQPDLGGEAPRVPPMGGGDTHGRRNARPVVSGSSRCATSRGARPWWAASWPGSERPPACTGRPRAAACGGVPGPGAGEAGPGAAGRERPSDATTPRRHRAGGTDAGRCETRSRRQIRHRRAPPSARARPLGPDAAASSPGATSRETVRTRECARRGAAPR